jgi:Zn-dependent peptidase ImmA (M78 family)
LAHEIKHCLDDPFIDELYPPIDGHGSDERTERVCDRFAAALLMPRVLLRADWADGLQDVAQLAQRYDVSRAAMQIRLTQLGLLDPTPRCDVATTRSAMHDTGVSV